MKHLRTKPPRTLSPWALARGAICGAADLRWCSSQRRVLRLAAVGLFVLVPLARAQDRADLDRTQIIGNRELPKVLYIVPWKKPLPDELSGRPVASVLDEALAPVDREVFRRELRYDAALHPREAASRR
jgi:hypothetical protein